MRANGRTPHQLRSIELIPNANPYAEGSCFTKFGNTHVMCTVSADEKVPPWMKQQGVPGGWLTAEYGMLPRATHTRKDREAVRGKQDGRSVEIGRLVGRALRAVVDLKSLGHRTLWVDCDVIQADGGTRCAAITGGYVALALAIQKLQKDGKLKSNPLTGQVAAVSVAATNTDILIDPDYVEDSTAAADANFVMLSDMRIIDLQTTSENGAITPEQFEQMFTLAVAGLEPLFALQKKVIG